MSYGAAGAGLGSLDEKQRTVPNSIAVLDLVAPIAIFAVTMWLLSFNLHYSSPPVPWIMVFLLALVPVAFLALAFKARSVGAHTSGWVYAGVMTLLALLAGVVLGDMNYWFNSQPFYDIQTMNAYWAVDPSTSHGKQLMDAGRVYFKDTARVDVTKSMGFKNLDTYCVAPIVSAPNATVIDFWAVGLNCCSSGATFTCGDVENPIVHAGLRAMRDEQRPFFRLAVNQAGAEYNISAPHPLFFYWMGNPSVEVVGYRDQANGLFVHACMGVSVINVFTTAIFLTATAQLAPKKRRGV